MLEEVKRTLRRWVQKARGEPEPPEPSREEARAPEERPPPEKPADFGVPVTEKERRHDGWSAIRPRRPGEDTDMGRDMIPDITDAGRDLLEPDDDQRGTNGDGGPPSSGST